MFDLIIRAGDVVTPEGVVRCDVAVAGETIADIATPGALSAESAKHVIDATGHIVMPGGIDPHVHLHHVWIKPDGTPLVTAGPEQVGRAALFGGTTTFIDFAYWREGQSALQAIESRDKDFVGSSPCDWAYHIMLHSEPPPEFAGQLAEAIQAGYPTLKIFTTNILPSRSGRMIDFGDIWEAFQVLAREGGLGVIHAEDNDIVMHMYAKLIREGRVGFEHLAEVHNQLSEDLSFRRVLRLAESVPGTAVYMMHVSAAAGVAATRCRSTSISSPPMPRKSWAFIRARERSRSAAMPISRFSIRPSAARCGPPICTRPTTRPGKAMTFSPGRR